MAACLVAVPGVVLAASDVAEFLAIPVHASSAGAGGADVARPSTGISPFANPAGALTPRWDLEIGHVRWLEDQQVNVAQVRIPLAQGRGGLAFHGRFVDHGSVPRFDLGGAPLPDFAPRDLSLGTAYAVRFGRTVVGVGLNYLQQDLEVAKGTGLTYDAGILVDAGAWRFGAAGTGLGGRLTFDDEQKFDIEQRLSVGVSYRTWRDRLEANLQYSSLEEQGELGTIGLHWTAVPGVLVLRAGYDVSDGRESKDFAPYRFGFGVGHGAVVLDYAFVPHEELGQAHLLALRFLGR